MIYPLQSFTEDLEVGGYTIPFSFTLPEHIPSSFHYKFLDTQASIKYKFQAEFKGQSGEVIKGSQIIQIRQSSYSYQTDLTEKKIASLKTWCCYEKGKSEINVSYPQDTYSPSQNAIFHVSTDNSQSQLAINEIECEFICTLRIKGSESDSYVVSNILMKKSEKIRIEAGTDEQLKPVDFCLNFEEIEDKLENMYTTKGKLIECVYRNKVSAVPDGYFMCCGDYASVCSVIHIVPSHVIKTELPKPPPGWDPKVLDTVELKYDTNFEARDEEKN